MLKKIIEMFPKRIVTVLLISLSSCCIAQNNITTYDHKKLSKLDSINAKINLYAAKKDTINLIRYNVEKIERFGLDTVGISRAFTNNMIYELIFMKSDDTATLNKGLRWARVIIDTEKPSANHYDTYANLLYKLGKKNEAIAWQTKAVGLSPNNPGLKETLEKMKNNLPTWPVN